MLVFIDESGDSGLKVSEGSSRFFTVALVVFEDLEEASACDLRIMLLKKELGWSTDQEFHFKRNSDRVRRIFLEAVSPYAFFYYGIVINKDPEKLWGPGFKDKASFYKYACGLVFENAKEKLEEATIVIDQSGNLDFRRQLSKYLKGKINDDVKRIRKVKQQRSQSNNLLQLADYVAGAVSRSMACEKKEHDVYRRIISHREMYVQVWPRL